MSGSVGFRGGSGTGWALGRQKIDGGIVSRSAPVLDLKQTWSNTTQTFTGLRLNVTDSGSALGSTLLNIQLGGIQQLALVREADAGSSGIAANETAFYTPLVRFRKFYGNLFITHGSNTANNIFLGGVNLGTFVGFSSNGTTLYSNNGAISYIANVDANNVSAQRNGTNAQTSRIYNTYTSSTNFERANVGWTANTFIVGTEKGSVGGAARQLELQTDGTTRVAITPTGNVGIGTTDPTSKLSVQGDVLVSGAVTATSFSGSGTNLTGIITSTTVGAATTISFNQINTNITISTLDPSGGNNGDIWIKYIP